MTTSSLQSISLGVRDFALPIPRTGSIETHSGYGPLPITGQEVHDEFLRKRKSASPGYQTEMRIKHIFTHGSYQIAVSGRVDGVASRSQSDFDNICLEEVKSDFNAEALAKVLRANPNHPYCMQLRMYGYLYHLEHKSIPAMQLLVVSIRDQSFETIPVELNVEEFEVWLELRIKEVIAEYVAEEKTVDRRIKQAGELAFPFADARSGQHELMAEVGTCVKKGASLMVQAPTGLGKTLGVMFPALRSSLSRGSQLIYVTPKNSQHAVARDAIQRLKNEGGKLKSLILTAKKKLCLKDETICNPVYCEYARDYYEKIERHDVVKKCARADMLDRHRFLKYAKKFQVCPFELSLDCIKHVDVVVGDYNYVFSPFNIMGRFSRQMTGAMDRPDLVIDEAHNLPARACGYYSAALSVNQLQELEKRMHNLQPYISIAARAATNDAINLIKRHKPVERNGRSDGEITIDKSAFVSIMAKINDVSVKHMEGLLVPPLNDPVLELHRTMDSFISALGNADSPEFVSLYQGTAGGTVKLVCCDASEMLKESYRAVRSVVGFSATLKPFRYYSDLMGLDSAKVETREFQSPFPKENRKLLVIPQISTKYSDRERNYGKIAESISRITALRKGNYVVFFPSFDFLYKVKSLLQLNGFEVLVQQRDMPQTMTDQYLNTLRVNTHPVILFAVQGGVFSEGVDYPGDMLIGTIIVGPALPTYDFERETLMRYFQTKYGDGNAYACIYPAMTKVVQSAGRVIRSQNERGLIVLLGRRFVEKDYVVAMPGDWYDKSVQELVSCSILSDIEQFWSKEEIDGLVQQS
jgi:DNA excision repair protein ERCC-2